MIAEEFGLVGVVGVVTLFALFVWRGVRTCLDAPDLFGRFLGMGLCILIGLQAGINMGVVTGLLPTKGLTLPLISYGGSSLVLTMAMLGVLLNVTSQARRQHMPPEHPKSSYGMPSGRRRVRAGAIS